METEVSVFEINRRFSGTGSVCKYTVSSVVICVSTSAGDVEAVSGTAADGCVSGESCEGVCEVPGCSEDA